MIITVCETCKRPSFDPSQQEETDGSRLASAVEAAAEDLGLPVRRHSCLMGCDYGCNVALQAPGKLTYALGTFEPTQEAAAGIVQFAALYAESETGRVPYKQWPAEIKGHFRARIPPAPSDET